MAIFTNQATLSYQDNVVNSNIVTGEILEAISATKTAVTESYSAGEVITYIISIVNSSAAPFTGLTVTDDLGAYQFGETTLVPLDYVTDSARYYVNGVLQASPTVSYGTELVISGINIPAGGNAVIVYETRANEFAPPAEGNITNTAEVTGGGISEPVTVTETVTPESGLNLTISKSICPSVVTDNGELTYTFVIQNTGSVASEDADNIVVSDIFRPILDPITVTIDGRVLSNAEYTYNSETGAFATLPGVINVPAASYAQNPQTGVYEVTPGIAVLEVTGTV